MEAAAQRRSEGVRRLTRVLSVVGVVCWLAWVGRESNGFEHVKPFGWVVIVAATIAAWFAPVLVCRAAYWVLEGFRLDRRP